MLGAERVYLTRAEKIDGVPTVPSRWLMRLQALLAGLGVGDALAARSAVARLGARARRTRNAAARISAPEPRPPLELRPRKMSVTRIEAWLTNPYAIFARDILKLDSCRRSAPTPMRRCAAASCTTIMSRFAQALSRRAAGRCPSAS